jgi:hypothetical protein
VRLDLPLTDRAPAALPATHPDRGGAPEEFKTAKQARDVSGSRCRPATGCRTGLALLSLQHLGELASLAACYWRAAWERDQEGGTEAARALAGRVARAVACNFKLAEEGWALFMAGLGADDPEGPLRRLPGWMGLHFVAREVRKDAFSAGGVAAISARASTR